MNRILKSLNEIRMGNGRAAAPKEKKIKQFPEAAEQLSGALHKVEQVIAKYPIASLSAALSAGVFLGWLVKRR